MYIIKRLELSYQRGHQMADEEAMSKKRYNFWKDYKIDRSIESNR